MAIDLPDVRGPVLVGLLQAAPCLVLGADVEAGHDRFDPDCLRRPEEDVKRVGEAPQDVGPAAADDDHVAGAGRLLDHVLRDLEHGLAGVEGRGGVGRAPGSRLGRDQRLAARRSERHQQPGEQGAGVLVLCLDLFFGELEAARHLVDDFGIEKIGLELGRQHVTDGRAARPKLPPDRNDRHGPIVRHSLSPQGRGLG